MPFTPIKSSGFTPLGSTSKPSTPVNPLDGFAQIDANYKAGKINAGDVAIQAVGQGAKDAREGLLSPYSPLGWAALALGKLNEGASYVAGGAGDYLGNVVGSAIAPADPEKRRQEAEAKLSAFLNHPAVKPVVDTIHQMANDPAVVGDLGAVGEVAKTAGLFLGVKQAAGGLEDIGSVALKPKGTPAEYAGKVTQAAPKDIPAATRALSNVDTKGVSTFKDLSERLDTQIKTNTTAVDEAFGKSNDTFKPQTFDTTIQAGSQTLQNNYVTKALSQLNELYGKIEDITSQAKIIRLQEKFRNEGLTANEVNQIARKYGSEFGEKAFSKLGEPLTSVNAQGYENVRTGVKEAARGLMPDENTRAIDKSTTDLIRTKTLVDNMAKKVQLLENKFQKAGLAQKVGSAIGTTVDIASGGLLKGLFRRLLGLGKSSGETLNPIELQKQLQKNLTKLDRLNKLSPQEALQELQSLE